jgi:hypothetical protein
MLNQRDESSYLSSVVVVGLLWTRFCGLDPHVVQEVVEDVLQWRKAVQYCYVSQYFAEGELAQRSNAATSTMVSNLEIMSQVLEAMLGLDEVRELEQIQALQQTTLFDARHLESTFWRVDVRPMVATGLALLQSDADFFQSYTAAAQQYRCVMEQFELMRLPAQQEHAASTIQQLRFATTSYSNRCSVQ